MMRSSKARIGERCSTTALCRHVDGAGAHASRGTGTGIYLQISYRIIYNCCWCCLLRKQGRSSSILQHPSTASSSRRDIISYGENEILHRQQARRSHAHANTPGYLCEDTCCCTLYVFVCMRGLTVSCVSHLFLRSTTSRHNLFATLLLSLGRLRACTTTYSSAAVQTAVKVGQTCVTETNTYRICHVLRMMQTWKCEVFRGHKKNEE